MIDDTIEANVAHGIDKKNINKSKNNEIMTQTELNKEFDSLYKVGQRGNLPSGGQRQKIALFRALYKETEIRIFNEPTSALDNLYEKNLQINLFIILIKQLYLFHIKMSHSDIVILFLKLSTVKF